MTNASHVISLSVLMNEAMELADGKASVAAVLLLDAAISIAVSTLGSNAPPMSVYLAEYIVAQTAYAAGGASNA